MQGLALELCKSLIDGFIWPALLHSVWLGFSILENTDDEGCFVWPRMKHR